eukprot:2495483-Lingulodinium_polyedra.AAC.1
MLLGRWQSVKSCKLYLKQGEVALLKLTKGVPCRQWQRIEAIAGLGADVWNFAARATVLRSHCACADVRNAEPFHENGMHVSDCTGLAAFSNDPCSRSLYGELQWLS